MFGTKFGISKTTQGLENTTHILREKLQYAVGNARKECIQHVQQHVHNEHNQLTCIHISDRGNRM